MAYPTTDTDLRLSAIAALVEANTLAGSRVEDSRTSSYGSDETYPRITVSTPSTSLGNESIGPMARLKRTTSLVVCGTVRAAPESDEVHADVDAALAAALDTIEGQVLHALASWASDFDGVSLTDARKGRSPDAGESIGQVVLAFECEWQYEISLPEIPTNLATIGIDLDMYSPSGGPVGRVESSRVIDLTE